MSPAGRLAALRRIWATLREVELRFLAAGIAYYAFVSSLPLLGLGIAIVSTASGDGSAEWLVAVVGQFLTPALERLVREGLQSSGDRAAVTLTGLAVFLWSGARLVRAVDIAFVRIYEVEGGKTAVDRLRDVALTLLTIVAGVVTTIALGAFVADSGTHLSGALGAALVVAGVAPLLLPTFYILPGTDVGVAEVLPGSLFTASAWTALQLAFRFYVANAARFALYGVLGTALVVMTWLYLGGLALLLGATLNAGLAAQTAPTD